MHVIAMRQEVIDRAPWLARSVYGMFNPAKDIAESYYEDPNWSRLAWGRHGYEDKRQLFARDPWENGFARNKANIERFIKYSRNPVRKGAPGYLTFSSSGPSPNNVATMALGLNRIHSRSAILSEGVQ